MEEISPVLRLQQIKGELGLQSKHYLRRLDAIQSLSSLLDDGPPVDYADSHGSFLRFTVDVLDLLLFSLALSDSNTKVRIGAIQCANKAFKSIQKTLPIPELDRYTWGFLATNADEHREVQNAAEELFLGEEATLRSLCSEEMIIRLVENFVTRVIHSLRSGHKKSSASVFEGFQFAADMRLLLFSIEGAIQLQLINVSENSDHANLVPALIVVASALLEECEISGDKPSAKEVLRLFRVIGISQYRFYVIPMISSGLYEGATFVSYYQGASFMDQEISDVFVKLETVVILKGISITLESVEDLDNLQVSELLNEEKLKTLEKLVEILQIPSDLVIPLNDSQEIKGAQEFNHSSFFFLRILFAILRADIIDMKQGYLMQNVILTCAAIASAENDTSTPLSWISKDARKIASKIVNHIDTYFRETRVLEIQEEGQNRKIEVDSCVGVERVVSKMLPNFVPIFRNRLKSDFDITTDSKVMSSSASLASAIIAAHQMHWCLKQVKHPHLSPFSTLLVPCALMALDHHSPHIKRQALKIFLHLKENLNPSELRWYKDLILNSASHTIIGCGELWPLVVQTSIQLVKCLEGSNPRAKWYRSILNEMLSELERHQRDPIWYTVWLDHIGELFNAMGLVLVAHFRRLLPLLFCWAHSSEDSVVLRVLNVFKDIMRNTWPRIPYHAERFWGEFAQLYTEASERKSCTALRSSIIELCALLKMCGGPVLGNQKEDNINDSLACLKLAVDAHIEAVSVNAC